MCHRPQIVLYRSRYKHPEERKNANECGGYRPITVSRTLSKVLEKLVLREVISNAFLPKSVHICSVDISAAFDSVIQSAVSRTLLDVGVNAHIVAMLSFWYSNSYIRVKLSLEKLSEPVKLKRGLRQGSVLSPILFNTLTSKVTKQISDGLRFDTCDLSLISYADDLLMLSFSLSVLQDNLGELVSGYSAIGLQVNGQKTEFLVFSSAKQEAPAPTVSVEGAIIAPSSSLKYLGLRYCPSNFKSLKPQNTNLFRVLLLQAKNMKYKFVLNPLNFLDYKPIQLEPGNISLIKIGRGELTKIKDSKLSRDQIEFSCNYDDGKAQVTVTGGHPSIVNGLPLKTGETVQMSNGDSLELLENKYKYKLLVKPYTEAETNKGESIKRKLSDISLTDDKSPGRKRSEKEVENEDKEGAIKRTLSGTDIDHEKGSNAKRQETGLSETARGVQPRGISSFLEGKIIAADSSWESVDDGKLLIFTEKGAVPSSKIAAFDLDGTIITTMSGLRFPRDASDWKILFPEIPKKLKSLISCGFKIVIITNQAGISGGKYKVGDLKKKMHNILKKLGVPAQIFVATGKTRYRKPSPSIWTIISHE
ncbi:hypothetical protein QYM36_014481, partial [Artemia franciscana]